MSNPYREPYDADAPYETKDLQHYQYLEKSEGAVNLIGGLIFGVLVPIIFWVIVSLNGDTAVDSGSVNVVNSLEEFSTMLSMLPVYIGSVVSIWFVGFIMFLVPVIKNRGGSLHTWGAILYCLGPAVFGFSSVLIPSLI